MTLNVAIPIIISALMCVFTAISFNKSSKKDGRIFGEEWGEFKAHFSHFQSDLSEVKQSIKKLVEASEKRDSEFNEKVIRLEIKLNNHMLTDHNKNPE